MDDFEVIKKWLDIFLDNLYGVRKRLKIKVTKVKVTKILTFCSNLTIVNTIGRKLHAT